MIKASGFLFESGGSILLLKRTNDGLWGFPGGHIEPDEDELTSAKRECQEEMGAYPEGKILWSVRQRTETCDYTTFYSRLDAPFTPELNDEHSEYGWFKPDELPYPVIQGAVDAIARMSMDELGVARYIAEGKYTSPQRYCNIWLYAIRITGTGVAYRGGKGEGQTGEFTFRPAAEWVTPDFLARCNGLPVVMDHPESPILTSDEFADRIVGTVFYPFVKNDEVWGVAKIYDDATKEMLVTEQWSTSPGVLADEEAVSVPLQSGETLLYEGAPFLLDHIAICRNGVWDKYGAPMGVDATLTNGENMAEHEKDRRDEERQDEEKVETVRSVDDKKDAECEMKDKKDADEHSIEDLYAKLEKLIGLVEGGKKDKKDAEDNDEFVPGEPLDAESDKKDAECKSDKKDESEEKRERDEKRGGEKANEELEGERKEKERIERDRKDAEAKRDAEFADIRKKLDEVNQRTRELTDEERNEISEAQAKADSVAVMFGESAPGPMSGETALGYRRRLAGKFQKHSDQWKGIKLSGLGDDAFSIAEGQIMKDAMTAAKSPAAAPADGSLREVKSRDAAGRVVSKFHGRPKSWMQEVNGSI